jgi:hypothetical protein
MCCRKTQTYPADPAIRIHNVGLFEGWGMFSRLISLLISRDGWCLDVDC